MPPSLEALTQRAARPSAAARAAPARAGRPVARPHAWRMLEALSTEPDRVGERLDRAVAAGVLEISVRQRPVRAPAARGGDGGDDRPPPRGVSCTPIWPGWSRSRSSVRGTLRRPPRGPRAELRTRSRPAPGRRPARGASAAAAELLEMAATLTPRGPGERSPAAHHRGGAGVQARGAPGAGQAAARERSRRAAFRRAASGRPRRPRRAQQRRLRGRRSRARAGTRRRARGRRAAQRHPPPSEPTAAAPTSDTRPRCGTPSWRLPPPREPVSRGS